jgi:hypothetical protein
MITRAAIRTCLFALSFSSLASLAACAGDPAMMGDDGGGSGSGSGSGGGMLEPPVRGFQITTPEITIQAHEEITYCYYFKTPNTEAYTVKRWESVMTTGSHHLILFTTPQLGQPEGTVSSTSCSVTGGGGANIASWVYSAQNAQQDLALPADDGTGKPVGMDIAAGQPAFLQMHYNNTGDEAIVAKAVINAEAYDAGVATTKTFAYVTYDGDINIPGGGAPHTESMDCNISPTSKVWLMSTHAHQLATHTEVRDGAAVAFQSDDWEHPGAQTWMTAPFYSFSSGKLTTSGTWSNPGTTVVHDGDSANTEEMCMASGYYFPATKTTICYNGFTF